MLRLSRRRRATLRRAALWGVPLVIAAAIGAAAGLSRGPQAGGQTSAVLSLTGRMGFVVRDIEVEGRTTTDPATIVAALNAYAGTPIFGVDLPRAKQQLEALPWVRSAAIERRLPGTLFVRLVERQPLAVWQHDGKQELIGRDGAPIPGADLSRFARLPTIVGDDEARQDAAQLLDMLATQPDLAARVSAAVLVGDRRWNVRIDGMIDVLLPQDDAAAAWAKLAQLEREHRVLQRDVQAIDLRLPDRLVMRVTDTAPKEAPPKKTRPPGKST